MGVVVLLGPQRFQPTVKSAFDDLGVEGKIAVVSAGWQEREGELEELEEHAGRPMANLLLYRRYEEALARDPELAGALRERQDRLQRMQELYRLRLHHALEAAREMMRRTGPADLVQAERQSAIRALRTLDTGHLHRIAELHREFEAEWKPVEREAVARHRREIAGLLDECPALAVAGGHVAVLLNRLRIFDLGPMLDGKPVVAWSAGAMALSERIVLFHDSPPQGPGNPEVLDGGLGWFHGVLPLPHARRRLKLDDPVRVALFARRFKPSPCIVLDPGARVTFENGGYAAGPETLRLNNRGGLTRAGRR